LNIRIGCISSEIFTRNPGSDEGKFFKTSLLCRVEKHLEICGRKYETSPASCQSIFVGSS
jgi:hypothetical protein